MALQIFVNGSDKTSLIDWTDVELQENLTDQVDVLRFSYDKFGTRSFVPSVLDEVILYQDSVKIFGGSIVDIQESAIVDMVKYQVVVKDYTHIMDRFLVVESYVSTPVINIICDILNTYINKNDRISIAAFETNEVWSAGAVDTTNFIVGSQARRLSSSGSTTIAYRDVSLNLQPTGFSTSDYIDVDVYVDTAANLSSCVMKIGNTAMTAYYSKSITGLVAGWNHVHLLKSGFSTTGAPSWSTITRVQLEVTAVAATTVNVTFDNWQEVKSTAFTCNNSYSATQVINYIAFNYSQPSTAFQKMAELFQWQWYVDQDKDIHFFAKFTELAVFDLTDTNGTYLPQSLVIKRNADQLRNSIYVRGSEYPANPINDDLTHQTDGTNKIFKLGYKYSDYTLTVAGSTKAVGIENISAYTSNVGAKQTNFGTANITIGDAAARTRQAQQVITTAHGKRNGVKLRVRKVGAPVDNLQVQFFSDSGSNTPSGSSTSTTATVAGGTLTTSYVETTFTVTGAVLNSGTTYHVVITRSGANDAANYYQIDAGTQGDYDGASNTFNASWSAGTNKLYFIELLDFDVLYNFNEKVIKFNVAPTLATSIVWNGKPYFPVIAQYKDNASISVYGETQHIIEDKTIKTIAGAQQRAQQEILEWSNEALEATYVTYSAGLHAGQTQNISSALRGLDENYLIKSITARARDPNNFEYHISLVTTKTMSLLYFLQSLITKDEKDIVINEDEVLNKIEAINETVDVQSNYTTLLCTERDWSDDALTTPNPLVYNGTSCDRWN
jgi:hypothetical protein